MRDFDSLLREFPFRPIRGCPGRYVLCGGGNAELDAVVRAAEGARRAIAGVVDAVWIVSVPGGGLISYEKPDGAMVHTLGDEAGFSRKLARFSVQER